MLRKFKKQSTILFIIMTGFLLGACSNEAPKAAALQGPVEVDIVTLAAQPAEIEVELPGRMVAYRVAEVRPQVTAPINGYIGKSMITEGASVMAQQSTALATIQQLDHLYVDVTQSYGSVCLGQTQTIA